MKTKHLLATAVLGLAALSQTSCLIQQAVDLVVREEYPGERPPSVIADVNGKPASNKWLPVSDDVLPPPSYMQQAKKAADGLPIGLTTQYSNIVLSPYAPYYNLDYKGFKPGAKVWDPYTRKPFYIPRTYTFN